MRISVLVENNTTNIQSFVSAKIWRLNIHTRRRTKCETVAKIQETLLAKFRVTTIYKMTRIRRSRKRVASIGRFTGVANFTDVTVFTEYD